MTTYTTYSKYKMFSKEHFNNAIHATMNKPLCGLWGCRGDEWKEWCESNDFPCGEYRFEWRLSKTAKVLNIRTIEDYKKVVRKYKTSIGEGLGTIRCIDFNKIIRDYDAMEIFDPAVWECRFMDDIDGKYDLGLYTWDVPSIVVFRPDKIINITLPKKLRS